MKKQDKGQTRIEYALLLLLIGLVIVAIVSLIWPAIENVLRAGF